MKEGKKVMNMLSLPLRILSSKAFLLWIMGGWILFYVISAIWLREAFGAFVAGIRENLFMQIPFVLFLLSGYLNSLRASRDVFQRSKMHFIAWMILSAGTLLFFTGFFMSATMRESGQRIIGEGDMIDPPWTRDGYRVIGIDPGLKDRVTDIEAAAGIFAYEPRITVVDLSSRSSTIGAFPPSKFNDTYYHIINFGIAPGVRIFEDNRLKDQSYMILRIIKPGSSDYFEIPHYPYRFLVNLEAEMTVQKGRQKISRFNLKDPLFSLRAFKGEKVIAEGDSKKGIHIGNLRIEFFKPTYWALVEAVKDPGVQVMHGGVVLFTVAVPLYLLHMIVRIFRNRKNFLNRGLVIISLLAGVTGIIVTGCSESEHKAPHPESRELTAGKRFIGQSFKTSRQGLFTIDVIVKGRGLKVGKNAADIILHDKYDAGVRGAKIAITPWMPGMGHGVEGIPLVTEMGGGALLCREHQL